MSTPESVAGLVRLLNIVGPQPLTAADALRPQLGNLHAGDYVPAHVLATLPNGRFHVLVKDQLLDLNLPANTQPGDTLELKVERNDGRLQFSMPAPQNPGTAQPAPSAVSLSPAARLLQEALQRSQTQEPARLSSSQPLAEGEPQAAPLAENLRQAVRESGLFYESHQQQWVAGNKPLSELLREPQARLAAAPLLDARSADIDPNRIAALVKAVEQASPQQLPTALRELAAALKQDQPASAPPGQDGRAPLASTPQGAEPDAIARAAQRLQQRLEASGALQPGGARYLDEAMRASDGDALRQPPQAHDLSRLMARPEVQNMVQQQIQALETHHLLWQGQVWPGQDLDWEIVGQREQEQGAVDGSPTHWTSRLSLDMPHLGRVVARLQLSQGQVSLKFSAENEETALALRQHQARLQGQFSAAELTLTSSHVVHGDDSGESGDGQ